MYSLLGFILWLIGFIVLILGLFIEIPYGHSYVMMFWGFPAGMGAGVFLRETLA